MTHDNHQRIVQDGDIFLKRALAIAIVKKRKEQDLEVKVCSLSQICQQPASSVEPPEDVFLEPFRSFEAFVMSYLAIKMLAFNPNCYTIRPMDLCPCHRNGEAWLPAWKTRSDRSSSNGTTFSFSLRRERRFQAVALRMCTRQATC